MSKSSNKKYGFELASKGMLVLCFTLALGLLSGNLHAGKLRLLSSIGPVNKLVAEIAGDKHQRQVLWRKNQSVHNVSFKPSQVKTVVAADLIFWVGPMLEAPLESMLSSEQLTDRAVRLATAGVYYLKHHEAVHEDVCEEDWHECDPHVWLSMANAEVMAGEIMRALSVRDPNNSEFYQRNFEEFLSKSKQYRAQLASSDSQANILALHNGWQYLGLHGYEVFSEHGLDYIGVKTALELQRKVRQQNVDCIVAGPMTKIALAENVLSEVENSPGLLALDPMGSDFPSETSFIEYLELSRKSLTHCAIDTQL